jgi:hypothetical protein
MALTIGHHIPLPQYRADEFFAFVESSDDFDPDAKNQPPEWWRRINVERIRRGRPSPDHLIWLDCISADAFGSLPWRDELCEINDREQALRRRSQINDIDASALVVAPLLLSRTFKEEAELIAGFGEAAWHLVRLGPDGPIPTLVAPAFEVETAESRTLTFEYGAVSTDPERASLTNVFNFNFLPDADLGADHGGAPPVPTIEPRGRSPTGRGEMLVEGLRYHPPLSR